MRRVSKCRSRDPRAGTENTVAQHEPTRESLYSFSKTRRRVGNWERGFCLRKCSNIHLTVLVQISRILLADFVGKNKNSSHCLPRIFPFQLIKLFVDVLPIHTLQGDEILSSALALEALGESNRVSSNSSVESGMASYDADQLPFDLRTVVLPDKTEVTITQRTRSTGIIEIRSRDSQLRDTARSKCSMRRESRQLVHMPKRGVQDFDLCSDDISQGSSSTSRGSCFVAHAIKVLTPTSETDCWG